MVERWSSRRLDRACQRHAQATAGFGALEQQRQAAAARAPTDYAAALELDALMPRLARAEDEVNASAWVVTIEADVERIVNDLLPRFIALGRTLDRSYDRFAQRADAPDNETEWIPFVVAALERERLRWTIHQAVGEDAEALDVSRGFDYVTAVREHWTATAEARENLFRAHGPGHKIRFGRPTWFSSADQLARLLAQRTAGRTTAHAVLDTHAAS